VRSAIKRVAKAAADRLAPRPDQLGRRVVLCYHSVNPSASYLSLSPELFDAHLDWLREHCAVVALSDLVAGRGQAREPQVAITFDDGYADNHAHALPSLAARGMPATFFLTAGFLERDEQVLGQLAETWHTPVEQLAPLDWGAVEEMRRAGMTFGSHTWSHRNLALIDDAQAEAELTRSREVLEARLGASVSAVAYPWGQAQAPRHRADLRHGGADGLPARRVLSPTCRAGLRSAPADPALRGGLGAGREPGGQGRRRDRLARRRARAHARGDGPCAVAGAGMTGAATAPEVSAVVTTYNYGRFLPDALDSVLAQSYPTLEIVVVDDGSTDETAAVVRSYANRGVRYVSRPHGGAGQARNTGLGVTSAPLVAFLDADDAWLPDRVEAGVAHLTRHPEIALAAAHAYACDERLRPTAVVPAATREKGHMLDALLVDNVVLNPSSVLVKRTALEAAGGFSEIPFGEDWDTWIEIAKQFPIGFIDRPLALVRRHNGSVTPRRGRVRVDANRELVERHLRAYQPAWKRPIIRRRAASMAYFHAGLGSVKAGDRRVARRYAVSAVALDPLTLTRRKAKLFARAFLPDSVSDAVRRRPGAPHA
jgi:glycosyltransferase involved in cell wall biosynthesis